MLSDDDDDDDEYGEAKLKQTNQVDTYIGRSLFFAFKFNICFT